MMVSELQWKAMGRSRSEVMWEADEASDRRNIPRRSTPSRGGGREGSERDEEASGVAEHHHPLSAQERRPPLCVRHWWPPCHGLQPLVPPWPPWHLEQPPLCISIHPNLIIKLYLHIYIEISLYVIHVDYIDWFLLYIHIYVYQFLICSRCNKCCFNSLVSCFYLSRMYRWFGTKILCLV